MNQRKNSISTGAMQGEPPGSQQKGQGTPTEQTRTDAGQPEKNSSKAKKGKGGNKSETIQRQIEEGPQLTAKLTSAWRSHVANETKPNKKHNVR